MNRLLIGFVFLFNTLAFASDVVKALGASNENFDYALYYQVKESSGSVALNLLSFIQVNQKLPLPSVAYQRSTHFGSWTREPGSCLNTRALVLVRDSNANVTYNASGCTVSRGEWFDVYTAQTFSSANDVQIDHFVPLKNAYMTGAFEWTSKKRKAYANYMGNKFHLLAVSGHENMSKGDNSPKDYLPPNKQYICQYLKQWLEVKLIWSLRITPPELNIIQAKLQESKCQASDFYMESTFLTEQRNDIATLVARDFLQ